MNLQQHPLSAKWKPMPPLELEAMAKDIAKHGQHEPGVTLDGMVLDGWHRYLASQKAGVKFRSVEYDGDDPGAFVISKNRHRRHQSAAELALSVVECRNWRPHGGDQSAPGADCSSTADMAEEAGVSERTIGRAKAAVRAGKADDVRSGKTTLKRAAGEKPAKEKKPRVIVADPKFEKLYEEVKAELVETKEALADLADTAASVEAFKGNTEFNEMEVLRVELRSVKRRRDELMRENTELKKMVSYLKKKAGKK